MCKKITILYLLLLILFSMGCVKKEPTGTISAKELAKDLSGTYIIDRVEEINGIDPLGYKNFFIDVAKSDNNYTFTISYRNEVIASITKPYMDREFQGRLEAALSTFYITRTNSGLACDIDSDDGTYQFVAYMKKGDPKSVVTPSPIPDTSVLNPTAEPAKK